MACEHKFKKERILGAFTGDYICEKCGGEFTSQEKNEYEKKKKDMNNSDKPSGSSV